MAEISWGTVAGGTSTAGDRPGSPVAALSQASATAVLPTATQSSLAMTAIEPPDLYDPEADHRARMQVLANRLEERSSKMRSMQRKKAVLNPIMVYSERNEVRRRAATAAAAQGKQAADRARAEKEIFKMMAEEKRSWDAYELQERNYQRMVVEARRAKVLKLEQDAAHTALQDGLKEEGLLFQECAAVDHRRWRPSAALRDTLQAHQRPVYTVKVSRNGRYLLTGSEDCTAKLWDMGAFQARLHNPKTRTKAELQQAAVAAVGVLGWECVATLEGHKGAVRDVDISPSFSGPKSLSQYKSGQPPDKMHLLATASVDQIVRLWDLSHTAAVPRHELIGHSGVVYGCCFGAGGDRLISCAADCTLRVWDVMGGYTLHVFMGHTSPLTSLCLSPTGKYLVSCTDLGQRSIRRWFADMPIYCKTPQTLGLRLRWARSGLIKRIRLQTSPPMLFLDMQEEYEHRESSDDSGEEAEYRLRMQEPQSVRDQSPSMPLKSKAVTEGYSITVTLVNGSGHDVKTDEYYRNCKLTVHLRGLDKFSGFYVAAVKADSQFNMFQASSGERYGTFFGELPKGAALSDERSVASGREINPADGGANEVSLRWKAPPKHSVGWITFRAAIYHKGGRQARGPGLRGGRGGRGPAHGADLTVCETVWTTLREIQDPLAHSVMASKAGPHTKKPRKRSFPTVARCEIFARALQRGDWGEAAMMLAGTARLDAGKTRAGGAMRVLHALQSALGANIVVKRALSVGVAWTSIEVIHEPPDAPDDPPAAGGDDAGSTMGGAGSLVPHTATTVGSSGSAGPSTAASQEYSRPNTVGFASPPGLSWPQQAQDRMFSRADAPPEPEVHIQAKAPGPSLVDDLDDPLDPAAKRLRKQAKAELKAMQNQLSTYSQAAEVASRAQSSSGTAHGAPQAPAKKVADEMTRDGMFGADEAHLRMPLPSYYPVNLQHVEVPDDNAGVDLLSAGLKEQERTEAIRTELQSRKDASADVTLEGLLQEQRQNEADLRALAARRRRDPGEEVDLGHRLLDFQSPLLQTGKGPGVRHATGLVGNPANRLMDFTWPQGANKRARAREDEWLNEAESRIGYHAPADFPLDRRRGALGQLPGGMIFHPPITHEDTDLRVARDNGGLLKVFESKFGVKGVSHQDVINQVAYSPDGSRVASACSDGRIRLWDPIAGRQMRDLTGGHEGAALGVCWANDSMHLASCGSDRRVVLWDTVSGKTIRTLLGHSDSVHRVAFADPGDNALVSCSSDGSVRVWHLTPRVPLPPPKPFITYCTKTAVVLNWKAPAAFNDAITAYTVTWRMGKKGQFKDTCMVSGDLLRREVRDLLPGTIYFFRVAAVNHMGQGPWSEISDMVVTDMDVPVVLQRPIVEEIKAESAICMFFAPRPTLPKMKPSHFILQVAGGAKDFGEGQELRPTWEECREAGQAFAGDARVRRRLVEGTKAGETGASESGSAAKRFVYVKHHLLMCVLVPGLAPGTSYRFRVAGVNGEGEGPYSEPSYSIRTPAQPPGVMPPLMIVRATPTSLEVKWVPGFDGGLAISSFDVRLVGREEVKCRRIEETKVMEGLDKGVAYSFQVRAHNNEGAGPWSEPSQPTRTLAESPAQPDRPVPIKISCLYLVLQVIVPSANGDPVLSFKVDIREHGEHAPHGWCKAVVFPIEAEARRAELKVEGLHPKSFYSFRVCALNAVGSGEWSLPCRRVRTLPPQVPPAMPAPRLRALAPDTCEVSWDPVSNEGGEIEDYVIECSRQDTKRSRAMALGKALTASLEESGETSRARAPGPPEMHTASATVSLVTLRDLALGGTYAFRIAARTAAGLGPLTGEAAELMLPDPLTWTPPGLFDP